MAGNQKVTTENINEVILRLLKLNPGTEIDYQTYAKKIRNKLAISGMAGEQRPAEEDILLREEFKRVRNKEGRFAIKGKKTKVSAASSPPPGNGPGPSGGGGGGGNPPKSGAIVKAQTQKISTEKFFYEPPIEKVKIKDVTKKTRVSRKEKDCCDLLKSPLDRINKSLDSIINTLTSIDKENIKKAERERKQSENQRRRNKEKELESKPLEGIKKVISAITKPFQSVWDMILNFIKNIILGRILIKLLDWISDPKNKSKIKSFIRFVKDWWPALLGGYILFGTSLGSLIRATTGMVAKFIFQIGRVAIPGLLRFISRHPLGAAATALFGVGLAAEFIPGMTGVKENETRNAPGTPEEKIRQLQEQKKNLNWFEKLQGKGSEIDEQISLLQTGKPKSYGFSGGGFSGGLFKQNIKIFNQTSEDKDKKSSGFVSGSKGIDKVPAMLTDGEFVMSVGAVNKYGVETLEAMNAAGGGTNQPKVIGGKTYAKEGGSIRRERNTEGYQNQNNNLPYLINKFFIDRGFVNKSFDISNPGTWRIGNNKSSSVSSSRSGVPTGSLMNDPLGAISRMTGIGIPKPSDINIPRQSTSTNRPSSSSRSGVPTGSLMNDPLGAISRMTGIGIPKPSGSGNIKIPEMPGIKMPESPKLVKEILNNVDSAPFRDAASAFIKHNIGGYGGPLSEMDLSSQSRSEIEKAIERAKKRTATEIRKAEAAIKELKSSKTPQGRRDLATQESFLKKLKEGAVRVQYTDYYDEDKKLTKDARNAQLILGQFWAHTRDKKEGGGYRIEDKYDFNYMKKKDPKTGETRDMNNWELLNDVLLGKDKSLKQRLQALYLMNPLKGKGDVDMIVGGQRTAGEMIGLSSIKALTSTPIGQLIYGALDTKPKDKNTKKLEEKRPWWDKLGMFGGASAEMKRQRESEVKKALMSGQYGRYIKPDQQVRFSSQQRNQELLESKRPWWDKMGWFGGGSRVAQEQQRSNRKPRSTTPSSTGKYFSSSDGKYYANYEEARKAHEARRARLSAEQRRRNSVPPVSRPKPIGTNIGGSQGGRRGSGANPTNSAKPRVVNPTHSPESTRTARSTQGINKK